MQQVLSDALRRAAKLFGDDERVLDGATRLTYKEVLSRCRGVAGGLARLGVRRGDRVATLLENGHRYLETYFAIPGSGAVLVPLNNRHAVPEHRYILEDAGVKVLIVDEAHAGVAEELRSSVKEVVVAPHGYEELASSTSEVEIGAGIDEDDLAGLFYTGGTTGAAKGVMLTHRNLVANALHIAIALGYTDRDTYLHAAPMFHLADGASTWALTWIGGRHAFVPTFDPGAVLRTVEEERVTCGVLVPTMINAVINHADVGRTDLSSLRLILHGAAPIATELLRRAIEVLGCSFIQGYGMTEAAPLLTVLPEEEELVHDERLRSAGREVVGVEVTVRRPDGSLCDPGEVGEIVARGPNIMRGYLNKPDETAEVLKDGWYWTRDMAYSDELGYLYIVDRAKDMIITGGENVYSIEVEDAVMAHPSVLEVAVIGVPDERWGERIHAVVVLKPGAQLDPEELKTFCKERIAGYKCPRSVEFVDALPKSGAGKIVKKDLRDKHWAGHERRVH